MFYSDSVCLKLGNPCFRVITARLLQESNSTEEEMWLLGMPVPTMTTYNSSYWILSGMPDILHISLKLPPLYKIDLLYFKDKKTLLVHIITLFKNKI